MIETLQASAGWLFPMIIASLLYAVQAVSNTGGAAEFFRDHPVTVFVCIAVWPIGLSVILAIIWCELTGYE